MTVRAEAIETLLGIRHQSRVVWRSSRLFTTAAGLGLLVLTGMSAVIAYAQATSPIPIPYSGSELIGVVWFSLLILPAVGGGGDDDASALGAVPAGKSFRSGVHFLSTASDLASGILVPALGLLGAFVGSYAGWAAGLALGLLGLTAGQVTGAVAGRLSAARGPTVSLIVTCGLAAVLVRYGSAAGPGSWFDTLMSSPAWYAALAAGVAGLWITARALTDVQPFAFRKGRTRRLPERPVAALYAVSVAGVARSLVARNSLISVVLVPLFARAVGLEPGESLIVVLTVSAAVLVGANGFAFDGGGTAWAAGRVARVDLLAVRLAVSGTWIVVVASVATLACAAVGVPVTLGTGGHLLLVCIGGAAAGLVPSVKRPSSVDLDLPRAQPAPPASAVGVMVRTMLIVGAAVTLPWWLAAVLTCGYATVAFRRASRMIADPVALASTG